MCFFILSLNIMEDPMMGELFNSSQRAWEEMRKGGGEAERMVLIKTHMHLLSLSFDYRWCRRGCTFLTTVFEHTGLNVTKGKMQLLETGYNTKHDGT